MKIRPTPMHHLLHMADQREHREHRLDEQTVLPLAALTQFQVGGIALGRMEAGVTQDNHALFNVLVQWHGLQPTASGFVPLSMAEFSL